MTIEEFNKYVVTKLKEFEKLANRDFPMHVGSMAKRYFEYKFYKSGFLNDRLKPYAFIHNRAETIHSRVTSKIEVICVG